MIDNADPLRLGGTSFCTYQDGETLGVCHTHPGCVEAVSPTNLCAQVHVRRDAPVKKTPDPAVPHVIGRTQTSDGAERKNFSKFGECRPLVGIDPDSLQLTVQGEPVTECAPLASLCSACRRDQLP